MYRGSDADEYCIEPTGEDIQERQSSPNIAGRYFRNMGLQERPAALLRKKRRYYFRYDSYVIVHTIFY